MSWKPEPCFKMNDEFFYYANARTLEFLRIIVWNDECWVQDLNPNYNLEMFFEILADRKKEKIRF